jgi:ABC-type branched-subunit amino acid transport system substrate-binding protein
MAGLRGTKAPHSFTTRRRGLSILAIAVTGSLVLAACGSSKSGGTTGGGGGASAHATKSVQAGADINLGVLTSLTGPLSSGFTDIETGVKARLALQNAQGGVQGHQLKYVMADDASTATGAVAATQKLIRQDKVYGILDASAQFTQAAAVTKTAGVPVAGVSFDGGPEWKDPSYSNLFDAFGLGDTSLVSSTYGSFLKAQGVTKMAVVGYDNAASGQSANGAMESAVRAGIQKVYVNTKVPAGSTNMGPIVQAIKASGADGLYMPVVPSSAFAVLVGLKQAGVKLKAALLTTGYGQDILKSPDALAAGQGVDFLTIFTPVESKTSATLAMQAALSKYAGETGIPSFAVYVGWSIADLFISGLEDAGPDASAAQFIAKLRQSTWDGAGLQKPEDFANPVKAASGLGSQNCSNAVQLDGSTFVPVAGGTPFCGTLYPGVTVGQ